MGGHSNLHSHPARALPFCKSLMDKTGQGHTEKEVRNIFSFLALQLRSEILESSPAIKVEEPMAVASALPAPI